MNKKKIDIIDIAQALADVDISSKGVDRESIVRALTEGVAQVLSDHSKGASQTMNDPKDSKSSRKIRIEMDIDAASNCARFWELRRIVDDNDHSDDDEGAEITATERVIRLSDAKLINPDAEVDDFLRLPVDVSSFTRVDINKIKQKIKEAIKHGYKKYSEETDYKKEEFKDARFLEMDKADNAIFVIIPDGTYAVLPVSQQIPMLPDKEKATPEQAKKEVFIRDDIYPVVVTGQEMDKNTSKPTGRLLISRRGRKDSLLRFVIGREVPEIKDKKVEIRKIAQIPGVKAKIAVKSNDPQINARGMFIGAQQESRKRAVSRQLNDMKLEFIEWSDDLAQYVRNALENHTERNPLIADPVLSVKVTGKEHLPDKSNETRDVVEVVVSDETAKRNIISGYNIRLAGILTGCRIQVVTQASSLKDSTNTEKKK